MGPLLAGRGFELGFAHRTFAWSSEAQGTAKVHVVIIGFSHGGQAARRWLFDYPDIKGKPEVKPVKRLSWYLIESDPIYPAKRKTPLLADLPRLTKGSQPTDGGHLLVDADEYEQVAVDPIAAKYLREFRQGRDLLNGGTRWCLWLEDAPPGDLSGSPMLKDRLAKVAEARRESKTRSVREQAETPYLFTQRRQPADGYLAMPEVSSERRAYVPMRFEPAEVIAGNKLLTIEGAPLWLFGYLQSAMFNAWVRTVAGRLKSDISLAPDLAYNTFPFPTMTGKQRQAVDAAARGVLDARDAHPEATLAQLYDQLTMPKDLRDAHRALDRACDRVLAPRRKLETDADRLARLFDLYQQAVGAETL